MCPIDRTTHAILFFILLLGGALVEAGCGGAGSNSENGNNGDGDGGGNDDETVVPAAPSDLTADAGDGAVELTWDDVDDADSYSVYRATSSTEGVSGSALETGVSQTTYTDDDAENGTTYYYRVTAVADEEGDPSDEVEGTPFAPPSELVGTSGDSQIQLEWAEATGAVFYNVYRDTASTEEAEGDPLAREVEGTSYTDETARNGTKYYYRVTSVNPEDEESTASGEVGKTPFSDPPDRP